MVIVSYDTPRTRATFETNPLFNNLPAVRRGSYLGLDLGTAVVPRLAAAAKHSG